jgi:hypothetical protein
MRALLQADQLLVGDRLIGGTRGAPHVAVVREDKRLDVDGRTENSPSAAAKAVLGYERNGWRWWICERDGAR